MNVKVSVIVAVGGVQGNLRNSLDSIKNQSLKEIEVLLLDAAADEAAVSVMKEFCSDGRFRYIKTDGQHLLCKKQRNKGSKG